MRWFLELHWLVTLPLIEFGLAGLTFGLWKRDLTIAGISSVVLVVGAGLIWYAEKRLDGLPPKPRQTGLFGRGAGSGG